MGRFTLDYSNCVFAQLQIWIFYRVSKIISLMLHVWNIYQHLPSFTIIYPINEPNVGKYTIHGASGYIQPLKMIEPCNPVGFTKNGAFFYRDSRGLKQQLRQVQFMPDPNYHGPDEIMVLVTDGEYVSGWRLGEIWVR